MNITKQQYEELMENLCTGRDKIMPHSVESISDTPDIPDVEFQSLCDEINALWIPLGLDKSLQTIVEEKGWHEGHFGEQRKGVLVGKWIETLKSPEANELLSYLYNLFCNNQER